MAIASAASGMRPAGALRFAAECASFGVVDEAGVAAVVAQVEVAGGQGIRA